MALKEGHETKNAYQFIRAYAGMTIAQIEQTAKAPWGTIMGWLMDDQIPIAAYIAVRDFPGESRSL